jgi:hypothetical protein
MVNNVEDVGNTLAALTAADIQVQIDRVKNEIFVLEEKKLLNESMSETLIELYDKRIEEKQNLIKTLEERLHSVESRPKTLQYDTATHTS